MQATALAFEKATLGGMIGSSRELRNVWHSVEMVARTALFRPYSRRDGDGERTPRQGNPREELAQPRAVRESELRCHARRAA